MSRENIINDIQKIRDKYIREIHVSDNKTQKIRELADILYTLDLTVYSKDYSFDSALYSALSESYIDSNISLHPGQLEIIDEIVNNDALIVSAPTSFGKTFCIFEYIIRYKPKTVVLVVPTLALVDEYLKKIIKRYKFQFKDYKIHTVIYDEKKYDFDKCNIFILTHDRVVQEESYRTFPKIDFLVIDEVYKLKKDIEDDRVLVLNMAYYNLSKISDKYLLLAPFIESIDNIEALENEPKFFKSNYSPVVNDIKTINISNDNDRYLECRKILKSFDKDDKSIIYFPTVSGIYKYVNEIICEEPILADLDNDVRDFIKWAKEDIHEEWCLVKALERGYLIHNGQIPIGTRMFQLDFYEESDTYNTLLCTSTLLEGINTTAKNIIITRPSRLSEKYSEKDAFTAFDFFNLVGRSGRLNQHLIGNAYYLKGSKDPKFIKEDAVKSIRFEINDDSKDIDIQKGNIEKYQEVQDFLKDLEISIEEYLSEVGSRLRFNTVLNIYVRYNRYKAELFEELDLLSKDSKRGRLYLIRILYKIIEEKENKLYSNIINNLLNKNRPKIKSVVKKTLEYHKSLDINYVIAITIRLKMSYIENDFYTKLLVIKFFIVNIDPTYSHLIDILNNKVVSSIEQLYFTSSKYKKMLTDLGIYERDIDKIISIIGNDFDDAIELKYKLIKNKNNLRNLSFISKYVIEKLI